MTDVPHEKRQLEPGRSLLSLSPTSALLEELEMLGQEDDHYVSSETTPLDRGNTLNGERCGWFRSTEPVEDGPWYLLPLDFFDRATMIVEVSAWQSRNMTGAVLHAGCVAVGDLGVGWFRDDESEDIEVLDGIDPDAVAASVAQGRIEIPICPNLEAHGWEIDFTFAPSVSNQAIGECLGTMFEACDDPADHRSMMVARRPWAWVNGGWHLQGRPPGARLVALASAKDLDDPEVVRRIVDKITRLSNESV